MGKYANFYNSIGNDREYDAESFSEWLKPFFKTGVFDGDLQVVEYSGMNIQIKEGFAHINGKTKNFEQPTTLLIEQAHATLSRIDNIVVRRNDTLRDFQIIVQKGSNSSNPQAPTPQRGNGIYDIVLAQVRVNAAAVSVKNIDIVDTRSDNNLCGWVTSTKVFDDTSKFENYYTKLEINNKFNNYYDKNNSDSTYAKQVLIKRNVTVTPTANSDIETNTKYPYKYTLTFNGVTENDIADASLGLSVTCDEFEGTNTLNGAVELLFSAQPSGSVNFSYISIIKGKIV